MVSEEAVRCRAATCAFDLSSPSMSTSPALLRGRPIHDGPLLGAETRTRCYQVWLTSVIQLYLRSGSLSVAALLQWCNARKGPRRRDAPIDGMLFNVRCRRRQLPAACREALLIISCIMMPQWSHAGGGQSGLEVRDSCEESRLVAAAFQLHLQASTIEHIISKRTIHAPHPAHPRQY